jgi:hypothetical protein
MPQPHGAPPQDFEHSATVRQGGRADVHTPSQNDKRRQEAQERMARRSLGPRGRGRACSEEREAW